MRNLNNGYSINRYDRINVILGKNGSGKSTLLREIDKSLSGRDACIRYITPERGGELLYDGSIETNRSSNPAWMTQVRRSNRYEQFRQSSVAEFRNLETLVLRSIESDPAVRTSSFTFEAEIQRINEVLDQVALRRSDGAGFDIVRKDSGQPARPSDLSSGVSELISLGVEILYFAYLCGQEKYKAKDNWLLLDEPDVHLHPDLQHRLMLLLVSSIANACGRVVIATHSTVILSSLCAINPDVRIGLQHFGNQNLVFGPADDAETPADC